MDAEVNTKMSHDLNIQHELLKTALEATDAYLGIEKQAVAANKANAMMIHDFTYHMSRAHDALQSLGVLNDHQEYMTSHVETMSKLFGDDDANLGDVPYAHMPAADYRGMDESRQFYADAKKRAKADTPQEKLSPAWKTKARARAAAAGREYPNLVDNV